MTIISLLPPNSANEVFPIRVSSFAETFGHLSHSSSKTRRNSIF